MTNVLQAAAHGYINDGISCIPVIGKEPQKDFGWACFQERLPTGREIDSFTGLAVISGKVSGDLAIRDFDIPGVYENWFAEHLDLAATLPTVETRRGCHRCCETRAP